MGDIGPLTPMPPKIRNRAQLLEFIELKIKRGSRFPRPLGPWRPLGPYILTETLWYITVAEHGFRIDGDIMSEVAIGKTPQFRLIYPLVVPVEI